MSTTTRPRARDSRLRRLLPLVGTLAAAPLALAGCGTSVSDDAGAGDAASTVTIESCGRDLTFDATPTSLVGMLPSQTELLLRLGVGADVVGQAQVDTSALPDDLLDAASSIPVLSTDRPPAREDLLAVGPDLVVSPTEYEFTAEQGFASIEQLAANGAQAYVATGGCADRRSTSEVRDLLEDITNLGTILDVESAATALRDDAEARLVAVEEAIDGQDRPTVAQVFLDGTTLGVIGAGIEADIIAEAGGDNVFDPDAPEFADFFAAQVNPEEIVSRSPDAIVFGVSSDEDEERIRAYLQATFPDVPAVRDGRLVAVPQSDLYPGALGNVTAVETIAAGLHPDAFL